MDPRSQIWTPLNPLKREIRLFVLAPDEDLDAVPTGRLITASLDQHLSYEAISHAWGSLSHPELVDIDNVAWPITHSLYDGLQRLRHPTEEKCFWVDALTIKQDDIEERAQQVQLMQHIFHQAARVQIWLGERSDPVYKLIEHINSDSSLGKLFAENQPEHKFKENIERMQTLARLDYWGRIWVIQEVALARDARFVYGSRGFAMKRLKALWQTFRTESATNPKFERYAQERRYISERLGPIIHASELSHLATVGTLEGKAEQLSLTLQRCRILQCTDARDRIYGLLGIMTAMFGVDFMKANYQSSVVDVYTEFAGRLITITGSLAILNQAEHICNSTPGLPTWVPDWSSCFNNVAAAGRAQYNQERFRASAHAAWLAPTYHLSPKLKLSGFIFGKVQGTGECVRTRAFWDSRGKIESTITGWQKLHAGSEKTFLSTITMDYPGVVSLDEFYKALNTPFEKKTELERSIEKNLYAALRGRRFFISDLGMLGLGPMDTRRGDMLVVLAGGKVPYVLRQVQSAANESPGLFSFVGEAYVHGVMYGELVGKEDSVFGDIWLE